MKPLTPGSKVKVLSGDLRSQVKIVRLVRGDRVYLKDALAPGMTKKLYNIHVHRSSILVVERNYKPPAKSTK